CACTVMQFQERVWERIGNSKAGQRWTKGPHENRFISAPSDNKTADKNVIARLDQGTRRNIRQLSRSTSNNRHRSLHKYRVHSAKIRKCPCRRKGMRKRKSVALVDTRIE